MAKRVNQEKSQKSSFSELNDMLSKFSPDGAIIEDSLYAKIDEWISTGSYVLNAALSGSLFGGMPNRRSLMLAGQEGTGKTYVAMSIVRSAQAMNYFPIYYDSEGSIDIEFVKKLGIDTSKFRLENVTTIEEFATLTAK
jgi:RecA/RadA recombinase